MLPATHAMYFIDDPVWFDVIRDHHPGTGAGVSLEMQENPDPAIAVSVATEHDEPKA